MIKMYVYTQPYSPEKGNQKRKLRKFVLEITLGRNHQTELNLFDHQKYDNDKIQRSLRRSKTTVGDLVLANKFTHFVTFTFNCKSCPKRFNCTNKPHCTCPKDFCERFNDARITSQMSGWLDRNVRKYGMKYLLVPERHKSGALHFHAMIRDYGGVLKDSGKRYHGKKIYNMSYFKFGFTNVTEIRNVTATSNYVKKYFVKDMALIRGNKRYWASRNLDRPIKQKNQQYTTIPSMFKCLVYQTQYYTEYRIKKLTINDSRSISVLAITSLSRLTN